MLLKSSTPVLPVELFHYIINHLGERQFNHYFKFGQLHALTSCARVCRTFSELCRVHIFSCVAFYTPGQSGGSQKKQLLKFVEAMKENSSLKNHVRKLDICVEDHVNTPLTARQFSRCKAVLLSFPNLQHLDISLMGKDWDGLWIKLGHRLLDTYVGRGTLHSILVDNFDEIPLKDIFVSPLLRTVTLGLFEQLRFPLPTAYSITSFKIDNVTEFPLSVLRALPMLQSLELEMIGKIIPGAQDSRTISFTLRELRVQDIGLMKEMFDFFYAQASANQTRAFARLEILEFHPTVESDFPCLCALLEQTPSLQTLIINESEHLDHYFPLPKLNLAEHISKTFPSLKKLILNILVFPLPYSDGYSTIVNNILTLLTFVANNNVLESLTLVLNIDLTSSDLPPPEPLHPLSSLLVSPSAFPCLNEVEVSLNLTATCADSQCIAKEFKDRDEELDRYIFTAMSELGDRPGMKLRGRASVYEY
ncbi:hypothetical protein BJ165DRAFT_1534684 [Panaeolus papilionaceus]|nr:hypothetical protein BJ165DRAFT_1534684 [Panaeolus papilionaceus]